MNGRTRYSWSLIRRVLRALCRLGGWKLEAVLVLFGVVYYVHVYATAPRRYHVVQKLGGRVILDYWTTNKPVELDIRDLPWYQHLKATNVIH